MESFRTEISLQPIHEHEIRHTDAIIMLGSCFTDNVGELLEHDGFNVLHNPMGTLYNPASIRNAIDIALFGKSYSVDDFVNDDKSMHHCLDFASKYTHSDSNALAAALNSEIEGLRSAIVNASVAILTMGTSYVFEHNGKIVGNCHKFPACCFNRRMLSAEESASHISHILSILPDTVKTVIFTVSPIRHTADGFHGNQLSKASLMLAIESAIAADCSHRSLYFPAYEIMMDDLRDYRFYASDMKHPSEVAVQYIYHKFGQVFFSTETQEKSAKAKKLWKHSLHRQLPHI